MSYDVEDKRGSKYIIQTPLTFATKIRLTGQGRDVARCCCQLLRLRYIACDHQTRQELSKAFVKMSDTKHNFANSSSLMYCRARSMTAPQPSRCLTSRESEKDVESIHASAAYPITTYITATGSLT